MFIARWNQPKLVWYAAYGSNTREQRFRCYIEGGRIEGNSRAYERCSDPSPPRDILPLALPYQLIFAGESAAWTGGVAFIQPDTSATTYARAYLITREQYHHVVRQENHLPHLPPLPLGLAIANGDATIPALPSRYDQIIYFGHRGLHPVLTTTASQPADVNPPSPAYLVQLIHGLREMGLRQADIVRYLLSKPGVSRQLLDHATQTFAYPVNT